MSIAIVAFSTSLMSTYGQYQFAEIIFAFNMLVIGILYYSLFNFALNHEMLYEQVLPYANIIKRSNLFLPVISYDSHCNFLYLSGGNYFNFFNGTSSIKYTYHC